MTLKPIEKSFWDQYLATLTQKPTHLLVRASFAGNRDITDQLLALYLAGKKTAGSGLVEDYRTAGDPLPQADDHWIILDSANEPRCIVKTTKTVQHKFSDVPAEIAIAEGEGDLSLSYWRKTHADFYSPYLKNWGIETLEDATVITEFYKVVYPQSALARDEKERE